MNLVTTNNASDEGAQLVSRSQQRMGKISRKPSNGPPSHLSAVQKRLPTSHQNCTRSTPPSVKPGAMVAQHNTFCPPLVHSNNSLHRVKCREITKALSRAEQEYLVYEDISWSDYNHILDRLKSNRDRKIWKRLTFFPGSQRLMVSSPSPIHESILVVIISDIDGTLRIIPVPQITLPRPGSSHYFEEDSICGIPDLSIIMYGKGGEEGIRVPDRDVMRKLKAYVCDHPDLLVVGKILMKQTTRYRSPGLKASVARQLRSSELMTHGKWSNNYGNNQEFAEIVVDGHTWFSLSSVEIHVWVRQHGDPKVDLNCPDGNGYASGTLFPTVDLDNVDKAFWHGFQLTKEAILRELIADKASFDRVGQWSPPARLLDPEVLSRSLADGAWDTAYQRYRSWYKKQKKLCRRG
ncbi:hypothetical protein J3A83DRAFT_4250782 [Scleroderma citrinum]